MSEYSLEIILSPIEDNVNLPDPDSNLDAYASSSEQKLNILQVFEENVVFDYSGPPGPVGFTGPTGPIGTINTGELDLLYVNTTGDENILGSKNFALRPTVNFIPISLSGDSSSAVEQYVKNDQGTIIYKGQPVYVDGSNGDNILIKLASNTGERTSSKTFGLLKQTLGVNEFGYVITEGVINQIDTSMANIGDPIWLGPTGNLIFGLTNKPFAPNHLVYLGFVERKHQNQGKIFVKPQNGFELEELHNLNINKKNTLSHGDVISYNSISGIWFNESLNTGNFLYHINNIPTGQNSTGIQGQIAFDSNYIYFCIANNHWKRISFDIW